MSNFIIDFWEKEKNKEIGTMQFWMYACCIHSEDWRKLWEKNGKFDVDLC